MNIHRNHIKKKNEVEPRTLGMLSCNLSFTFKRVRPLKFGVSVNFGKILAPTGSHPLNGLGLQSPNGYTNLVELSLDI